MNNVVNIQTFAKPWLGAIEVEPSPKVGSFEPFVDEFVVARFLQISERRVLEMARKNQIPAHPLGNQRKTWRFRMSEMDAHFSTPAVKKTATITVAVPGTQERKRLG